MEVFYESVTLPTFNYLIIISFIIKRKIQNSIILDRFVYYNFPW